MKRDYGHHAVLRFSFKKVQAFDFGIKSWLDHWTIFIAWMAMSFVHLEAQTDTVFWFAAPDVSYGYANFDKPILLRISSTGLPADLHLVRALPVLST